MPRFHAVPARISIHSTEAMPSAWSELSMLAGKDTSRGLTPSLVSRDLRNGVFFIMRQFYIFLKNIQNVLDIARRAP